MEATGQTRESESHPTPGSTAIPEAVTGALVGHWFAFWEGIGRALVGIGGHWWALVGIGSPRAEVAKGQSAANSEQQGGRGSGKQSLNLGEQSLL